jgi:SAM-dependent methyltransferase
MTMTNKADEHQRLILDQFTKQAVPFSQMQNHSPELLLAASGAGPEDTILDVACGPGLMACAFAQVARHVTGIDLTPAMIEQVLVAKINPATSERLGLLATLGEGGWGDIPEQSSSGPAKRSFAVPKPKRLTDDLDGRGCDDLPTFAKADHQDQGQSFGCAAAA